MLQQRACKISYSTYVITKYTLKALSWELYFQSNHRFRITKTVIIFYSDNISYFTICYKHFHIIPKILFKIIETSQNWVISGEYYSHGRFSLVWMSRFPYNKCWQFCASTDLLFLFFLKELFYQHFTLRESHNDENIL